VQRQVSFNRVPEEKVPGGFGAKLGQVQQIWRRSGRLWCRARQAQQGSGEGFGEGSRKPWCKAKSSSLVSEKVAEAKPGEVHLTHGNLAEVFPALGFAARFRKICKYEMLWLLGIPPKIIFFFRVYLPIAFRPPLGRQELHICRRGIHPEVRLGMMQSRRFREDLLLLIWN